uniref:Uncharacterized protein n=1 Tax=Siphoviridae sp. ctMAv2 TaxID=2826258 RepID=A0A8S5LSY6_9CAUD|nr:MAG TPA: hypothetical protein [Siphoviridae sp. ctMAv2]
MQNDICIHIKSYEFILKYIKHVENWRGKC